MCTATETSLSVLERDVSSRPLLPRLKAQAADQVEDTERTPAHNELSTTVHVRQLL